MRLGATVIVIVLVGALTAGAQTRPRPRVETDRMFVSLNAGYQLTASDFDTSATLAENGEARRLSTDYTVKAGPAFSLSGGMMLTRNLGVGVGVDRFSRTTSTMLSGSTPHPFFFNRPRSVSGSATGLRREELAVHLQMRAALPLGRRFRAMVFGGPSFFNLKQGVVDDFQYSQSYPYDAVSLSGVTTSEVRRARIGTNVGGDVEYFLTRQLGVGLGAQYARATIDVVSSGGDALTLRAGGIQTAAGLRVRF